jgi:hypothetical protein
MCFGNVAGSAFQIACCLVLFEGLDILYLKTIEKHLKKH